jgi:outer membrane receptor protein involved in Fe transport
MHNKSLIVLSAMLIGAAPPTRAEAPRPVERVDVIGHYDNGVGTSNAASQGVVRAALIENRPALRTGELLEFVPGMIVTAHSGEGKANQYFMRGFNLDHGTDFATFVDGMPVNMRSHAHGQGYTDLNFLIPELVQRISYRKGPYDAEDGDFASVGSARMGLFNSMKRGIAALTVGPHDYARGVVAASLPVADGNLLYALELGHNNGPWVTPERFRKASGVLRYSAGRADNGYSITAMRYASTWNASNQIPQRAVHSGQLDRFGAIDPTDGGDTARHSLSFDMKRRNDAGLLRLNAYAVRSHLDLFSNVTYFLDDPVNGDQFKQSEQRSMLGLDLSQTWSGKLAHRDARYKLGLQTRHDRLAPLALHHTVGRRQLATLRSDTVKQSSAGLYAENTLQWNSWLRTIAGVRYDSYFFDVASNIAENSGKVNDHIVSPRLSMVLGPWARTEFFLNYGDGFHSNDARGTTARVTPNERLPIDPVTPLVRTRGSELGARTEIIPGLQSSLALWRLKSGSELVFSGDAGDTAPSRASDRYGLEWNNHYIATNWLLFELDLAYSRARYTEFDPAGNAIPGAVGKVASFGATVTELGAWSGAFQLRYFGPRPLVEDNRRRSQSTALAYLRAGYRLDRNWKVELDVFNVFDRQASDIDYFYASRLPGEPADGVDDYHSHPVQPRSLRLTLRANF